MAQRYLGARGSRPPSALLLGEGGLGSGFRVGLIGGQLPLITASEPGTFTAPRLARSPRIAPGGRLSRGPPGAPELAIIPRSLPRRCSIANRPVASSAYQLEHSSLYSMWRVSQEALSAAKVRIF